MKPRALFLAGFTLALAIVAYTTFVPAESATQTTRLGSAETHLLDQCEIVRNVVFFVSIGLALLGIIMAFVKPRLATGLWGAILFITLAWALLPSEPVQLFPFARAVFWIGMAIEFWLWFVTRITLRAQAVPNPALQRTPDSAQDSKPPAPGPAPLS